MTIEVNCEAVRSSFSDMQIHSFKERLLKNSPFYNPLAVARELLAPIDDRLVVGTYSIGSKSYIHDREDQRVEVKPNVFCASVAPGLWNSCQAVIGGGRTEEAAAHDLAVKIAAGIGINLKGSENLASYEKMPLRVDLPVRAEQPMREPVLAELVHAA